MKSGWGEYINLKWPKYWYIFSSSYLRGMRRRFRGHHRRWWWWHYGWHQIYTNVRLRTRLSISTSTSLFRGKDCGCRKLLEGKGTLRERYIDKREVEEKFLNKGENSWGNSFREKAEEDVCGKELMGKRFKDKGKIAEEQVRRYGGKSWGTSLKVWGK